MTGERTLPGWRISLRPHGCSRYVNGAFLAVWLCGWGAGEAFALWMLVRGAIALLTGNPPDPGREPLTLGLALAAGLFILFWLTLWTIGGIAAFAELFRLLWGEDCLEVAGGRLTVTRIRGPFRTKRSFERASIRRISVTGRGDRLVMESARDHIELSRLGTRDDRIRAAAALRVELAIPEESVPISVALPKGWEDIITPDGVRVLVADRSVRQKQTRTALIVTLLLATLTFVVGRDSLQHTQRIASSMILLAFTLAAAAGTLWLARGRYEWRLEKNLLTLRKRYGMGVRSVFQGRQLVLEHSTDSDGDPWLELFALSEPDPPLTVRKIGGATVTWRSARPKNRRSIARKMNDTGVLRDLGHWLARQTGLEFEDRTTPAARTQELAELRATLEQSGRFGRLAAKLVDRLGDKTNSGS
jgi:hypothetical protein